MLMLFARHATRIQTKMTTKAAKKTVISWNSEWLESTIDLEGRSLFHGAVASRISTQTILRFVIACESFNFSNCFVALPG